MANISKGYDVTSKLYGPVTVCQIDFRIGGITGSGPTAQVDAGTGYATNDFSGSFKSAKLIPFTRYDAVSMMLNGGTREGDIAWSTNKESFNDAISWLWGNLTSGGVGFVKFSDTPTNSVHIVESHGLFYDSANDYERIGFICETNSFIYEHQASANTFAFIYHMDRDYYDGDAKEVFLIAQNSAKTDMEYGMWLRVLGTPTYTSAIHTQTFGVLLNNAWNHSYMGKDYPEIIFDLFTLTYASDTKIAYHTEYDFNFGSQYIQEGSVDEGDEESEEENDQGGISTSGGGGGGFDTSSDSSNRVTEEQFAIDAINSGFVSIYMPNQNNIQAFCNFLFSGITEDVSIVLKRLVSNPLDYVISLNMVHYTPTTGSSEEIKFCGIGSGVNAPRVTKQMQIINCGSIDIDEQFKSFMDYNGHSKIKLYAPYCGIFPIDVNDVMGGSLSLQYIIDNLTGSCVAQVYGTRYREHVGSRNESFIQDRLLYEFTGNVFEQVPLSAVDYRGTIQGLMQIAGGISTVAGGNGGGVGAIASGVMNLAPDVIHSGNGSTSYGYMGVQTPFLFLERQVQNYPLDFQQREGLTSNIYSKLNDLTGYTEIDIESFKTEYLKCTDAEREELLKILGGGFII